VSQQFEASGAPSLDAPGGRREQPDDGQTRDVEAIIATAELILDLKPSAEPQ
jgi:hypothetical protein